MADSLTIRLGNLKQALEAAVSALGSSELVPLLRSLLNIATRLVSVYHVSLFNS